VCVGQLVRAPEFEPSRGGAVLVVGSLGAHTHISKGYSSTTYFFLDSLLLDNICETKKIRKEEYQRTNLR